MADDCEHENLVWWNRRGRVASGVRCPDCDRVWMPTDGRAGRPPASGLDAPPHHTKLTAKEIERHLDSALSREGLTVAPKEPTREMVRAAMRAFEPFAGRLLRYPEKDRWHLNDVRGMEEAIKAAISAADPH